MHALPISVCRFASLHPALQSYISLKRPLQICSVGNSPSLCSFERTWWSFSTWSDIQRLRSTHGSHVRDQRVLLINGNRQSERIDFILRSIFLTMQNVLPPFIFWGEVWMALRCNSIARYSNCFWGYPRYFWNAKLFLTRFTNYSSFFWKPRVSLSWNDIFWMELHCIPSPDFARGREVLGQREARSQRLVRVGFVPMKSDCSAGSTVGFGLGGG